MIKGHDEFSGSLNKMIDIGEFKQQMIIVNIHNGFINTEVRFVSCNILEVQHYLQFTIIQAKRKTFVVVARVFTLNDTEQFLILKHNHNKLTLYSND